MCRVGVLHRFGFWSVNKWIRYGEGIYDSQIDVIAPTQAGIYYIFLVFDAELEDFYVASGTDWPVGHPEWDDGNDIAVSSINYNLKRPENKGTLSIDALLTKVTRIEHYRLPSLL